MNEEIKKSGKTISTKTIIIAIVALVLTILIIVGVIAKFYSVSDEDREDAIITAGENYYDKYMSKVTGLDEAEITIEMLQNVIDNNGDDYDLSVLEKCESDTKVLFTLEDGKITDQTVELNCK